MESGSVDDKKRREVIERDILIANVASRLPSGTSTNLIERFVDLEIENERLKKGEAE